MIFQKYAIKIIAALGIAFAAYTAGVYQVSNRPLEIKTECQCEGDKILESINLKLDNIEKANSINFDKVKNFKGNLSINQNYTLQSDSAFRQLLITDMKNLLNGLKVSRCR